MIKWLVILICILICISVTMIFASCDESDDDDDEDNDNGTSYDEVVIEVPSDKEEWTEVPLEIHEGDFLAIAATGSCSLGDGVENVGPDGFGEDCPDCSLPNAPRGALIGTFLGAEPSKKSVLKTFADVLPFLIGYSFGGFMTDTPPLGLKINDDNFIDNMGGVTVTVRRFQYGCEYCENDADCAENLGPNWECQSNCCVPKSPDTDDDDDASDDDDDDVSGDTWTDSSTGLTWQNGDSCCYKWGEAKSYCQTLNWSYYSDWRLPTISELRSLIRGCDATKTGGSCGVTDSCLGWEDCWNSDCDGCAAGGGPGPLGRYWPAELKGEGGFWDWYWSSSWVADGGANGYVWYVVFDRGHILEDWVGNSNYVRCVR